MQENTTLLIGGDLVPTESNKCLFIDGNVEQLFGHELLYIFKEADFRIFNLEAPITDIKDPINKCGPNLSILPPTLVGIRKIGTDILGLANNHILDQGSRGLECTIELLDKNGIAHLGAEMNLSEAVKPLIIEHGNKRIGIYACAEHEFTIAGENHFGANPFDPFESLDHIVRLKDKCDYIIVLYHGGKEHYRYPSPYLQKACRKMVEKGADLVVCQHSHCIGCRENYQKGTIVYGQGNFLFDASNSEFWQTSLLLEVYIDDGFYVKEIPLVKERNCVRMAQGQAAEDILAAYKHRSKQILCGSFIENEYQKFADSMLSGYLGVFLGKTLFLRILNKLCLRKLYQCIYSKRSLLAIQNFIECEAHRELVIKGLVNLIKK